MFEHVKINLIEKIIEYGYPFGSDSLECGVTQAPRRTVREWC